MKYSWSYDSKIGPITIGADDKAITDVYFGKIEAGTKKETLLIKEAYKQIDEYLTGKRKEFDIPLNPSGTDYQKLVWSKLITIPFGETKSYKDIAVMINNKNSYRAVGNANGSNPIPIIIPCHRVIGADGSIGGYSCGLDIKIKLLEIENIQI